MNTKGFSLCLLLGSAAIANAGIAGDWEFNGNLNGNVGAALTANGTVSFENGLINGSAASYAKFSSGAYFIVPNSIGGNAGGTYTNQFTIIMDVFFPTENPNPWTSLLQTSVTNANDGDWFINPDGGLGITADYSDAGNSLLFDRGNWRRLALAIDTGSTPGNGNIYRSYVDGILQNTVQSPASWGIDGRYSLDTVFEVFADNDGEVSPYGFVNSLQLRDTALSAEDIRALGGASANGLGAVPEPSSFLAVGLGFAVFGRRRSSKNA